MIIDKQLLGLMTRILDVVAVYELDISLSGRSDFKREYNITVYRKCTPEEATMIAEDIRALVVEIPGLSAENVNYDYIDQELGIVLIYLLDTECAD